MMNRACLLLSLCVVSKTLCGEPTDPCSEMAGAALDQCRSDRQALRQQQLEQQLEQQEQRQNQLDRQQREVQQQLESIRLQNEDLRKQLRETASRPAPPAARQQAAADDSQAAEFKQWTAQNPWFGADYPKTEFAVRYAKKLQQERPELTHRELLDALSAKVNATFGAKH